MPYETSANTLDIGEAIVNYLSALTYPGTSTIVYALAQLEAIKDVIDLTSNGGICCEVYGDIDTSERRGFGGRIWDTQSWFILSLCSLDTPALAKQIYLARDALTYPFQQHATLGDQVTNLFQIQLKPNMKFFRVLRNGTWLRAHLAELETKQEWAIQGGVIS